MTIGKRIKEKRLEMNLSQRELASKLGYSDHTTLTRIEGDKVNLSESRIKQIAKALEVSPAYLMGWEGSPEKAGEVAANVLLDLGLQRMLQNYVSLSDENKELVNTMIATMVQQQKDRH